MQLLTDLEIPSLETVVLPEQTSEFLVDQTPETSEDSNKLSKLGKKQEDTNLLDESKEISDAILEIVEEGVLEARISNRMLEFEEQERQIYAALETAKKGLDYSKLHYGKVAQPLAVQYSYSDFESDDEKTKFSSQETISIKEVDELIQETILNDILNVTETNITPDARERFKYFRLFNQALVTFKYDPFNGRSKQIWDL